MMPSTGGSDNPMVQHAGHRNFEKLLRCGVRLFEYPHTLLHQKVMTIDGVWSAIGSSNFDDRSFETNDEITLGISDAATAAAARCGVREVRAALHRDRTGGLAQARDLAQVQGQRLLPDERDLVTPAGIQLSRPHRSGDACASDFPRPHANGPAACNRKKAPNASRRRCLIPREFLVGPE